MIFLISIYRQLNLPPTHFLWLMGGARVLNDFIYILNTILWTDCQIYHIQLSRNIKNSWFKSHSMTVIFFSRFFNLCSNPVTHLTMRTEDRDQRSKKSSESPPLWIKKRHIVFLCVIRWCTLLCIQNNYLLKAYATKNVIVFI